MINECAEIWGKIRSNRPLVHCISNYVTLNDVANTVLACGASPAMCEHPQESGDFALLSDALYLNLGTLTDEQKQAMMNAVTALNDRPAPIVVDPVACGVIARKGQLFVEMAEAGHISIVKGNHAEIMNLAGVESSARGVDSLESGAGLEGAYARLAADSGMVVAGTGQTDIVSDGVRTALLHNGTHMFGQITGAGCMLGGVIAACAAVAPDDPWLATVAGITAYNIAGEMAASLSGPRPGSFRMHLLDCLYELRPEDIAARGQISW